MLCYCRRRKSVEPCNRPFGALYRVEWRGELVKKKRASVIDVWKKKSNYQGWDPGRGVIRGFL